MKGSIDDIFPYPMSNILSDAMVWIIFDLFSTRLSRTICPHHLHTTPFCCQRVMINQFWNSVLAIIILVCVNPSFLRSSYLTFRSENGKKVTLNEQNPLWKELRHTHIAHVSRWAILHVSLYMFGIEHYFEEVNNLVGAHSSSAGISFTVRNAYKQYHLGCTPMISSVSMYTSQLLVNIMWDWHFYVWLVVFRITTFAHKPQVIESSSYSGSTRHKFCSQ